MRLQLTCTALLVVPASAVWSLFVHGERRRHVHLRRQNSMALRSHEQIFEWCRQPLRNRCSPSQWKSSMVHVGSWEFLWTQSEQSSFQEYLTPPLFLSLPESFFACHWMLRASFCCCQPRMLPSAMLNCLSAAQLPIFCAAKIAFLLEVSWVLFSRCRHFAASPWKNTWRPSPHRLLIMHPVS